MAKRTIPPEPRSAQEKFSASYQNIRQLKVRQSYYDYQYRTTNGTLSYKTPPPVPWVQIKGYWLNQAGFTIGSELSVHIQDGCITLKVQPSTI